MNQHFRQLLLIVSVLGVTVTVPVFAQRQVSISPVSELTVSRVLHYPATVVNLQLATVSAETSGRILVFPVEVGDEVLEQQELLEIDCTNAINNQNRVKAGLKRLLANRQLTRQQLQRAQRLNKTSSISREELDQRQTQLEADNASIEEQQSLLESATQAVRDCKLQAPFAGVVIDKRVNAGAYVQPGTPVLTLLKQDAVEVQLELPSNVVAQLKQAPQITLEVNAKSYPLKLRKVLPRVNSNSFQQLCRLTITSEEKPTGGSLGLARFETPRNLLPARYIEKREGKFGFFTLQDNRARFVELTSAEEGQAAAVDIPYDSLIITSHLNLLSDEDIVEVKP
jgi:RND family efflux transporter MFP subunit